MLLAMCLIAVSVAQLWGVQPSAGGSSKPKTYLQAAQGETNAQPTPLTRLDVPADKAAVLRGMLREASKQLDIDVLKLL
jgi:hypothetical protein